MIGSSLPLCYPQIGASRLLYPRALCTDLPIDKTYPTLRQAQGPLVGVAAFSSSLRGLKLVPLKQHSLVPPRRIEPVEITSG
jgi:hypothetical protein